MKLAQDESNANTEDFKPKLKEILGLTGGEDPGEVANVVNTIDDVVDLLGKFLIKLRIGISEVYGDKLIISQIIKDMSKLRWQLYTQI